MIETEADLPPTSVGEKAVYGLGAGVMNSLGGVAASWSAWLNKDQNGGLEEGVNPFTGESVWGVDAWNGRFNSAANVIVGTVGLLEDGVAGLGSSLKNAFSSPDALRDAVPSTTGGAGPTGESYSVAYQMTLDPSHAGQ